MTLDCLSIAIADQKEDLTKIPYDSMRAAQLRMWHDLATKRTYDFGDYLVIAGDPSQGISLSPDAEYMKRQFEELGRKRRELMDILRPGLKQRHERYLKEIGTSNA